MNKTVKTVAAIILVALATAGVAYAVNYIITSNTITGTVTTQATLSLLLNGSAVNGTSIVEGVQVTLTTTLSDSTNPAVTFYNNGVSIGAVVPVSGTATLLYNIPMGDTAFSFYADCSHP